MLSKKWCLSLIPLFAVSFALNFSNASNEEVKAATDLNSLVKCYDHALQVIGDFSINEYCTSLEQLQKLSTQEKKPANLIMYIDENGVVTDASGVSLGISYKNAFNTYIKDTMIPCYYVRDNATVDSFKTYYETWQRWDFTFVSDDVDVLTYARKQVPVARGVLDYSKTTFNEDSFKSMMRESTLARANTLLLSSEQANYDTVRYFQARFKTIWIDERKTSNLDFAQDVLEGAYGFIVKDTPSAVEYLKPLNSTNYKYNQNRAPYNIAHRGLAATNYENSLEGCIEAYEKGATHIEIDFQMTKDKKLVVIHDETLDRTTNGTGLVSNYTAEELKQFKIISTLSTKKEPGVAIPMLDEIFNEFKGKDLVIIVEIKTFDSNAIDVFKEYIDEADIADQVVAISFSNNQIKLMDSKVGYIPCADLNSATYASVANGGLKALNTYNYIYDCSQSGYSANFVQALANRGYPSWMWTYTSLASCYTGDKDGILGITNNCANEFAIAPTKMVTNNIYNIKSLDDVSIEVGYENYNGVVEGKKLSASPVFLEKIDDNNYKCILQAKFDSGSSTPRLMVTIFSNPVSLHLEKETPSSSSSEQSSSSSEPGGGGSSSNTGTLIAIIVPVSIVALGGIGVGIYFLLRKKK